MKALKTLAVLFFAAIAISSCTKEPSASFYASKEKAEVGDEISFTNTSFDADHYSWDFGDGGNSDLENPTHTYSTAGNYVVTLTAYSKNGKKKDTYTQNIQIINKVTKLKINKIVVTNYPVINDGNNDPGPDIYLSINSGTSSNTNDFTTGYYSDCTGEPLTYSSDFPVYLTNIDINWSIGLWDYDSYTSDDFIGGIYFKPSEFKEGYPSTIDLSTSTISMTLYVSWE